MRENKDKRPNWHKMKDKGPKRKKKINSQNKTLVKDKWLKELFSVLYNTLIHKYLVYPDGKVA